MGLVTVAAAVIERDGRFLLTRRLKGTHLEGVWEFPGGKCEPGETLATCLARELQEELGLPVGVGPEILVVEHAYPDRTVRLHFYRCETMGEPQPLLGQEIRWVAPTELRRVPMPEADAALIDLLGSDRGQTP